MKKTVIIASILAMLVGAFYSVPNTVVSKSSKTGVIKVCWAEICITSVMDTKVKLLNKDGKIVGECEIVPPEECCKIEGDFESGYYHFLYYQSDSKTQCKSAEFYYENGTEAVFNVICRCP
jgi:hypothetical protein